MANRDSISSDEERNPYASKNRWRHQESSKFARFAAATHAQQASSSSQSAVPRDADARANNTNDLAKFLNTNRVEPAPAVVDGNRSTGNFKPIMIGAAETDEAGAPRPTEGGAVAGSSEKPDGREIVCGPLLNYRRMEAGQWYGSVLVVTRGGGKHQEFTPTLLLGQAGHMGAASAGETNGEAATNGKMTSSDNTEVSGQCLYSDPRNTFWAFDLVVPMSDVETKWQYALPSLRLAPKRKPFAHYHFFVPAITESMRILFFSCNGFSVGTDEEDWSGPALWNDVLRQHAHSPFHVMIGGGDQIYNDGIRVKGPLRPWTEISNPRKRREYPFPEKLRQECDDYYLKNYIRWYSTEPFASANGQVAQLNIWDDHDIIDGFGSYVNEFMKCDVFRGIGGTAHKYYMLFQHHLPPPPSTYTTDEGSTVAPAPSNTAEQEGEGEAAPPVQQEQGPDPNQLMDTYVAPRKVEPCYIVGPKPGPYVAEHSHNLYCRLGARIAFLGIDARTERTRHQVNYPETYDAIFERLDHEFSAAASSGQPIQHLVLLLGIPIAYPRLTWLENVFKSPLIAPIKFLNRRFGIAGGFINHFDGSVDLLDDLDDHYTARTHKKERNALIERLQSVSAKHSVRITILGGDVHLAALGRFYSKLGAGIPTEQDPRYMANVVSSAIVNKPPPQAIANLLARRNKIHHLNHLTDETLLHIFDKDPGTSNRTAGHNKVTMPSRNYAMLTENSPNNPATEQPPPASPEANGVGSSSASSNSSSFSKGDGHKPIHAGEVGAGTKHKAANMDLHGRGNDGSLDVCIRVEMDQHDLEGNCEGYGITVPWLKYVAPATPSAHEEVAEEQPAHT